MNETVPGRPCERTFELTDISIRAGGDGRTVTAYAAMFDTPAEVHDQDGHYMEVISPGAFTKTIGERAGHIQVFYNHGKTLYGTPSERFSMPLGTPEEIREDARGLITVTRYNRTALADEVLESIRNGDIKGQSFSGRFMPAGNQRSRGRNGELDTITRSEVALREYGPTPMPVYKEAAILGVRTQELAATIAHLPASQRAELLEELATLLGDAAPSTSPPTETPGPVHVPGHSEIRRLVGAERRAYLDGVVFRKDSAA